MYKMKLLEVLEDSVIVRDIEQKLKEGESHEAKAMVKERSANLIEDRKGTICCELVQAFDKKKACT